MKLKGINEWPGKPALFCCVIVVGVFIRDTMPAVKRGRNCAQRMIPVYLPGNYTNKDVHVHLVVMVDK